MADRWVLHRAGITNVYQYGDEVLRFGGGRLLLRGVNGSGKSTAMNMLLPFLLEADTRRIDAAGEQSGVLRSWMLSGRDEQQPVGYLWVEMRRARRTETDPSDNGNRDAPIDGGNGIPATDGTDSTAGPDNTAGHGHGPGEYLTFGCGIRANRSTDRVTTWWFVTDRRPGIDLALVEARTPLSTDALRAALGPGAVFAHDQRTSYRAEVRNRLYGGADLDQHVRLLHVVRSPRVGDRIDLDLPAYLTDALPQLSEVALDDAAQPLEDLEEHRRNVEDLTRTATALDALTAGYRAYARTELRQRADDVSALADESRRRRRTEARAIADHDRAEVARAAAQQAIAGAEGDEARLRIEIETLKGSAAYQAGAELTDLRRLVAELDRQVAAATAEAAERARRRDDARAALVTARDEATGDVADLRVHLSDLGRLAVEAGLAVTLPDVPVVATERRTDPGVAAPRATDPDTTPASPGTADPDSAGTPHTDTTPAAAGTTDTGAPDAVVPRAIGTGPAPIRTASIEVPAGLLDVDPLRARLGDIRAAGRTRRGDLHEVQRALDAVDRSLTGLEDADRRLADADDGAKAASQRFGDARSAIDTAVATWRAALHEWTDRLEAHRSAAGLAPGVIPDLGDPDLAGRRDDAHRALLDTAQAAVDHHQHTVAALAARRDREASTVDELAAVLAELEARALPDPPAAPWQRAGRGPCVAELVDFRADLGDAARAGLEAAMEAAGLLGAEVTADGGLALADGQLVTLAGRRVGTPLGDMLVVTVPSDPAGHSDHDGRGDGHDRNDSSSHAGEHDHDGHGDGHDRNDSSSHGDHGHGSSRGTAVEAVAVEAGAVAGVLGAISTDPDDLAADDDLTVVTTDGRFRIGPLRGRYTKDRAVHIGLSARRAALARQRAEAAAALDAARDDLAATERAIAGRRELLDEAIALRTSVPTPGPVADAVVRAEHAERALDEARDLVARRRQQRLDAERAHADAVDTSRRLASTLSLPADRAGLDRVGDSLREVTGTCDRVDAAVRAVVRSTTAWARQADAWQQAADDAARSVRTRDDLERRRTPEAMKLATLEDSVGVEYDEIVAALAVSEADLATTTDRLDAARAAHVAAAEEAARLAGEVARARDECAAADVSCVEGLAHLRRVLAVPGLVAAALGDPAGTSGPDDPADTSVPDGDAATHVPDGGHAAATFPAVDETPEGARTLAAAVVDGVPPPEPGPARAEAVRQSLRQRRDTLGAGWDAEDHQPDETVPLTVEVTGPLGRMPLQEAATRVGGQLRSMASLLSAKQDQALRNLLQGLIAREVAEKLHASRELIDRINGRLASVRTSHGIGVTLRWTRRDDLDPALADTIALLAKPPDLRTADEDRALSAALSQRIGDARRDDPEAPYRELIARVLDYRSWFRMALILHRPGRPDERLTRRTALSEGEKKMVSYLPLFAAVAASCDALAEHEPSAPRFVLLDDAFAKVSEDNHAKLFGLLVDLDLDFIATSERLWGTHATVPELAITEVLRDADLGVIVLEHSHWDGALRTEVA